eukprot:jgi/Ulvmu1/2054/UM120_0050.1
MQRTSAPYGATRTTQVLPTPTTSSTKYLRSGASRINRPCCVRGPASPARWVTTRAASLGDEVAASDLVASGFEYGLSCTQGPREAMEDELCVVEFSHSIYAAVFDGHGGDAVAQWLNENLHEFVKPALAQSNNYQAAMEAAFHAADTEILDYLERASAEGETITGAGSTASVVVTRANEIVTANIGDSSAILMRRGQQLMLTQPHRVYGKSDIAKAEIQRVQDAGGWVSRDGRVCDVLAVSRAFGDWEFKGKGLSTLLKAGVEEEWWDQDWADTAKFTSDPVIATPAVTQTAISEEAGDEFLVVATDGLWDFYSQNDAMRYAREAIKAGVSAQDVAENLVDRSLKRYTSDNVAVIVVKFPWGISQGQTTKSKSKNKKFMGIF